MYAPSIQIMENFFNAGNTTSLHIICEKGYLGILKYYLPFYVQEITEYPVIQEVASLMKLDYSINPRDTSIQYLPIHKATLLENIALLSYIHNYFLDQSFVPRYLDMDYKEEITGENCALLACRISSYKLISFFHKTCKLNLRVKNNSGLNAINVLIDGSKDTESKSTLNCLRYLIEVVGIDCEYMYQFNLHNAIGSDILDYLIIKLKEIGINVSKREVEVSRMLSQVNLIPQAEEDTIRLRGKYFLSELQYRKSPSVDFEDESRND